MTDYKQTLNLPETDFPMKANLAEREPLILAKWEALNLYQALRKKHQNSPNFILHDGPPYANGEIHLGTTLNKVLKDIVLKSKTLSGFNTPYIPGWDCHGLPIELKVEKKQGKAGDKLSTAEFRQACRDYAASQVDIQKADFIRLGVLADWQNPYLTMQASFEAGEVRALAKIIENGHLLRGFKPVHWCTACGSALAEAEVEYQDKTSPAIDVAFYAVDPEAILNKLGLAKKSLPIALPIWTTTPWTLPANEAVCLHPEFLYDLVEVTLHDKIQGLVIAQALLTSTMQRYAIENFTVLTSFTGATLEGTVLQHPFLSRQVKVIVGDHVTTEAGTGNVHTAPAHGVDDYRVGLTYDLPVNNPVNAQSCFIKDVPIVAGMHVFKANDPILEALKASGHLLQHTTLKHSYPHCWRHKTPLIFRATPQWFISMDQKGLREKALTQITQTQWIPAWGENRITSMLTTRPDWCISRQRTWGVPMMLLVHKETQALHPHMPALMEKIAQKVEKEGLEAWHVMSVEDLIGREEAAFYEKTSDTLDVWFDSGVSHFTVLNQRPELRMPADLYLEGSDQHRGWFQSSLLTSVAIYETAPFKQVLTHGYVVDGKGLKMSKSVGNVIAPKQVIQKLGADILRLWAAASDHTGDINFSDEILMRSSDAYRRLRNTARFLLSNLFDFNPLTDCVAAEKLVALDQAAIVCAMQLQEKILMAYENYHFQVVYQEVHNFCAVEMGSFYLDVIKDRLYTAKKDGLARRSAQTALYHILQALVHWIAPILSFTAEEIWQYMPGDKTESVFLSRWYQDFPAIKNSNLEFSKLMNLRDVVNKQLETARKQGLIGSGLDAEVVLSVDEAQLAWLKPIESELRFILITSNAVVRLMTETTDSVETEMPGIQVQISVSTFPKCERCWQHREEVGQEEPGLCKRCVSNVVGEGEPRYFA